MNNSMSRKVVWSAWTIASIFYAYQYVLRVMPNIMLSDIIHQFHINSVIFGQFSGVYYIGYSLMHLPIGIMLDRYGPRKIMPIFILLTVIGLLPLIFAEHWIYAIAGRVLIGIGSSAAILGTFKIIRMTFAERKFTRMLSFSVTIGLIGAIYGGGPVSYMCDVWGYIAVLKIFAVIGLLLAILSYRVIPEIEGVASRAVLADIREILTNSKIICLCIFGGMMVGPLEGFADVWGTEFLSHVYGFSRAVSATLPSMIFIGMCFGAPVLSFVAEKTQSYLGTVIGAAITMAVIFVILLSGDLTSHMVGLGFIIVGICCAYQIIVIYKASTYAPERLVGLSTAVANMIIMIFGYAFHTLISLTIHKNGGLDVPQAYAYGIAIIPISLSLGAIGCTILAYKDARKM